MMSRRKMIGFAVLIGMLALAVPQIGTRQVTVQAATVKKVTGLKKAKPVDGSYFYSKKKQYDGFYRKISWKKVKNVKGYQVFRYNYFSKKWEKILTTKKNFFKITDMCEGEKVRLKVRAYRKKKKKTIYGAFSKPLTYMETTYLQYMFNDKIIKKGSYASGKKGYHLSCDQQAFMLQNEYREKAGVMKLGWSDVLYEICKARAKDIVKEFSHGKKETTAKNVLKSSYGFTQWDLSGEIDGKGYGIHIISGENIYSGSTSPKAAMAAWKNSSEHYHNMIHSDYRYGAVASYEGRWVAIFSMVDVDGIVINNNYDSLEPALQILANE